MINIIGQEQTLSDKKYWKKFALNNKSIVLNILTVLHNTWKKRHAYKSKYKLKRENQVILLMIIDGKRLHYLAVRSLYVLFCKIISNNEEEFYCLNCFHSYSTKNRLNKHKDVCENHDYCYIKIPREN